MLQLLFLFLHLPNLLHSVPSLDNLWPNGRFRDSASSYLYRRGGIDYVLLVVQGSTS